MYGKKEKGKGQEEEISKEEINEELAELENEGLDIEEEV